MGGDKFLHAPQHRRRREDQQPLDEPYYAQQFTGGRRFDDSRPPDSPAAAPRPAAVRARPTRRLARDAAPRPQNPELDDLPGADQAGGEHHNSTVQFMRAVAPQEAAPAAPAAPASPAAPVAAPPKPPRRHRRSAGRSTTPATTRPSSSSRLAGAHAQKAGLPPELPVMAALVESGVANNPRRRRGLGRLLSDARRRSGTRASTRGYPENPKLQAKWFIDHALALKGKRIAAGDAQFGKDPATWGNWIADVERPAAQYRGRYQMRLGEARGLLGR